VSVIVGRRFTQATSYVNYGLVIGGHFNPIDRMDNPFLKIDDETMVCGVFKGDPARIGPSIPRPRVP
jgi:hypothetical protein